MNKYTFSIVSSIILLLAASLLPLRGSVAVYDLTFTVYDTGNLNTGQIASSEISIGDVFRFNFSIDTSIQAYSVSSDLIHFASDGPDLSFSITPDAANIGSYSPVYSSAIHKPTLFRSGVSTAIQFNVDLADGNGVVFDYEGGTGLAEFRSLTFTFLMPVLFPDNAQAGDPLSLFLTTPVQDWVGFHGYMQFGFSETEIPYLPMALGSMQIIPVPEPAAYALILLGGIAGCAWIRCCRRRLVAEGNAKSL